MSRLYDLESRAEDLLMIAAPIRIQGRGKLLVEGGSQGGCQSLKKAEPL